MGRRKRNGNHSLHKKNLIQDSEGNEENRYPVPDSNKTKINYANELNEANRNTLKEEILQVITENFMEMLLDMVSQNRHSRNSKITKIKNIRKHKNKSMN
jgi:predicted house-cleaning noncanonical NTP pyrophosphatase (MazG superfamily)